MSEVEPEGESDDAGPAELSLPSTGTVEDRLVGLFEGLKLSRSTEGDEARATQCAALALMAALLGSGQANTGRGACTNDGDDQGRADPCGSEAEFEASPGRTALREGHHDRSTITVTAAVREPRFNGGYAFDGVAQRWQHTTDPGLSCTFGPVRDVGLASADPDGGAGQGQSTCQARWWPRWQFASHGRVASPPSSPSSSPFPSPSGSVSGSVPSPYFQIVGCLDPPTGALQHWYCGSQSQAVPDPTMRVRYTRPAPAVDEAAAACIASLRMKALAAVITVTKRSSGPDSKTAMNMLMRLLNKLCAANEVETAYRVLHNTLSAQLRTADHAHPGWSALKMAVTISLGLTDKGDIQAAAATFTETMATMAARWGTTLTSANLAKLRQQAGQKLAPKSTSSKSPRGGLRV